MVRYVELNGVRIIADGLGRCLTVLKLPGTDEHGEAMPGEVLRNLQSDPLVRSGNEGNAIV